MRVMIIKLLVLLLCIINITLAAYCHGKPSPDAKPNINPIYNKEPIFIKSVNNGKLYHVGDGDDMIPIVHLYGSPYEKGYAHGELMKEEAYGLLNSTWQYFEDQVEAALNGSLHKLNISQDIIDLIADIGLEAALDVTFDLTEPFTGTYFYEEMHGLADSSGVSYDKIRRVHMIGELTKGTCSMYGAWGTATKSSGGRLFQLRALDWAVDGPFKDYPQLTIYHGDGSESLGNTFVNIGWSGWIGSITGFSQQHIGISEIGVSYPDSSFGKESRIGIPFTNILRDIIQFDNTLQDAEDRLTLANRTCDLILGVGDGNQEEFRGVQYSYSVANFISDKNLIPKETWHPQIENVVYFGMDWLCPSYTSILAKQLQYYHGDITPQHTINNITSIVQTGDLHVAIYDLQDLVLYVANARASYESSGPPMAYDRQFVQVDMKTQFSITL